MKVSGKLILITFLNIISGGIGTILIPFLFENEKRFYYLAIILGSIQIVHFVHIFFFLFRKNSINEFYEIIAGENTLKYLITDEKQKELYEEFEEEVDKLKENLDLDDDEDRDIYTKYEEIKNILKNHDVTFLKKFFAVLSFLSYFNSLFQPLIKTFSMNESKVDEDNLFDIFQFSIFNPGTGLIITSFKSIKNCELTPMIVSIIGTIIGFLLMLCPYITGFAVYLIKTINSLNILFLIKIHLMCFGIFGTFFSIIYAFLQKDINKEITNPFDIKCCDLDKIPSKFGFQTVMRIIANLILPGTGTFSLLCKDGYQCDIGIFFTALIQFINGILFHFFNILTIFAQKKI